MPHLAGLGHSSKTLAFSKLKMMKKPPAGLTPTSPENPSTYNNKHMQPAFTFTGQSIGRGTFGESGAAAAEGRRSILRVVVGSFIYLLLPAPRSKRGSIPSYVGRSVKPSTVAKTASRGLDSDSNPRDPLLDRQAGALRYCRSQHRR